MAIVGEKKDVRPLLLKLGMALAFSFAGFLYSHFKRKRIGPPRPPPSSESPGSEFRLYWSVFFFHLYLGFVSDSCSDCI